jgi:hypothetical protein
MNTAYRVASMNACSISATTGEKIDFFGTGLYICGLLDIAA